MPDKTTQWGQCVFCERSKTIMDTTHSVSFTVTFHRGNTWDHEACCYAEYLRIEQVFQPFAEIELVRR